MKAASYSEIERLRDGQAIEIRALRSTDRDDLLSALGHSSAESRYRRFFSRKSSFSENEIAYFVQIDYATHVALVAVDEVGLGSIVGGGRYITVGSGGAEIAFFVVDSYQGKGIGTALMRHLAEIGRDAGLKQLSAEVLAENAPMMSVFRKSGLPVEATREGDVFHVVLQLA
jgi:GNAT superfamily N-acetyltransferase